MNQELLQTLSVQGVIPLPTFKLYNPFFLHVHHCFDSQLVAATASLVLHPFYLRVFVSLISCVFPGAVGFC